jgi:hypothetical protein
MIRRAKKADRVKRETLMLLFLSLSLCEMLIVFQQDGDWLATILKTHILGAVWIVYYLFTCLGHEV